MLLPPIKYQTAFDLYWLKFGRIFLPEILIVGCGRNIQHVDPELRRFIRSTGMKLEAVDSVYVIALICEICVLLHLALLVHCLLGFNNKNH